MSDSRYNEYGFSRDRACWSSDCHNEVTGWTAKHAAVMGTPRDDVIPTCSGCHKFYTGETRPKPSKR